MISGNFYAS
ncbi:unnamed protein product, partial [Rotaria sp. Silwood2]